jgi:hypothetical protein
MKASVNRSVLVASAWLGMTTTASCRVVDPCDRDPEIAWVSLQAENLWVGDTVAMTAGAGRAPSLMCGSNQPSFAADRESYTVTIGDTSVVRLTKDSRVAAVGSGTTSIAVRHRRGGTEGSVAISIARPVSQIRFVVTPAAPVAGDTVEVVAQAIDGDGKVAPEAVFSGMYLVAEYPPSYAGPIRLSYAPNPRALGASCVGELSIQQWSDASRREGRVRADDDHHSLTSRDLADAGRCISVTTAALWRDRR